MNAEMWVVGYAFLIFGLAFGLPALVAWWIGRRR